MIRTIIYKDDKNKNKKEKNKKDDAVWTKEGD